jgi:recombination protein RecA
MLLDGIQGLDLDMITIISSDEKPLPAEYFIQIAESYMKDNDNLIVVIDSISSLIPARDLAEEMSGERRPGLPKLLSNFTKRLAGIVPRKNHIVMMVTHFIANLGAVGNAPKYVADCGTKIRYQADTMLEVSYTQGWEDSEKNQIGQIVHWKIGCSAAGGKPRTQYTSYLRYGHGIDAEFEIIAEAVNLNIIDKSSSWLSYKDKKYQGMAKFADALRSDPEMKKQIEDEIKALLCE